MVLVMIFVDLVVKNENFDVLYDLWDVRIMNENFE